MDTTELIKTFIILVAVIDPIGNIPVYISLTSHKTDAEHKSIALKTSVTAVIFLSASFLLGKYIIAFFGIEMSAFKLIGAIFLVYISFTLLSNAKFSYLFSEDDMEGQDNIFLMPLTFPLFIGPAAISTVIIQSDEISTVLAKTIFLLEFIIIGILIWVTLRLSNLILKTLSKTGKKIINQIMGLLLGSLAIGMIAEELKTLLPGLS